MLRSQRDLYSLICGRRRSFTQIPKIKKEKKGMSFWGEHRDINVRGLLLALGQQRALKLQRLKTFSFLRSWCWIVSRGAKDRLNQKSQAFFVLNYTCTVHTIYYVYPFSVYFQYSFHYFFGCCNNALKKKKSLKPKVYFGLLWSVTISALSTWRNFYHWEGSCTPCACSLISVSTRMVRVH